MSLELTVNDTAPTLTMTLNADLTGATVAVHIKKPNGTILNKTGTIVTPAAGTVSMAAWVNGDLDAAGVYTVEAQVTFAGGKIQTFRRTTAGARVQFEVAAEIA
jgi:hypothetical protein